MRIYLGGSFTGLSREAFMTWRNKATELLNSYDIDTLNPANYYNTVDSKPGTYEEREVRDFDFYALNKCNLMLVNLNYNSIGTAQEEREAELHNIPVIGFGTNKDTHPWMILPCSKICTSLEDAVNYIVDYYGAI